MGGWMGWVDGWIGRQKVGFRMLPILGLIFSFVHSALCCRVLLALTHQWVPLQLIFSKRSGGRRLEGARRVVLDYL